jgi:threonyl-tRNA synthetase
MMKVPYMAIIGDKEKDSNTISLRLRNGQNVNGIPLKEFFEKVSAEVAERRAEGPWFDQSFVPTFQKTEKGAK